MIDIDLYSFDKTTVVSRLNRWGEWKNGSGAGNGYPSHSAFVRLSGESHSVSDWIGNAVDSECIETDRAVNECPLLHREIIKVEYYLAYKEIAVKAHLCGLTKREYYNFLSKSHQSVADNLNKNLHNSHKSDTNMVSCA